MTTVTVVLAETPVPTVKPVKMVFANVPAVKPSVVEAASIQVLLQLTVVPATQRVAEPVVVVFVPVPAARPTVQEFVSTLRLPTVTVVLAEQLVPVAKSAIAACAATLVKQIVLELAKTCKPTAPTVELVETPVLAVKFVRVEFVVVRVVRPIVREPAKTCKPMAPTVEPVAIPVLATKLVLLESV